MRMSAPLLVTPLLALLAACGGEDAKEREVMKPEETVFRDLVTAPGKVEDSINASMDAHRDALEEQIRESEGDSSGE